MKVKQTKTQPKNIDIIPDVKETLDTSKGKKVIIPEISNALQTEYENAIGDSNEPLANKPPEQKEYELKIYAVNTSIEESHVWGTLVQVTPWVNRTGFEIMLCNKTGSFQHLSITKEELDLVNMMIKKMTGE